MIILKERVKTVLKCQACQIKSLSVRVRWGKANLDDDFNFTWLSVSEDIIVLTYRTINDTFENVKLNVIKQVKVEEKDCLK